MGGAWRAASAVPATSEAPQPEQSSGQRISRPRGKVIDSRTAVLRIASLLRRAGASAETEDRQRSHSLPILLAIVTPVPHSQRISASFCSILLIAGRDPAALTRSSARVYPAPR